VYSPKGGSGCTTVSVNLAIALHSEDTRTVIVDGNLQFGDVAIFMNEQGKNTFTEIAPRVDQLEPELLESILIKHGATGVRILAAPQKPELDDVITSEQFEKVISYLRQLFSYVVIDTSSGLSEITKTAISLSDVIVLLATQEIPSVKSARLFLDLLLQNNFDKNRIVFAMNRYDKRISITPERVADNLKQVVGAVIPFDERIVLPSVNRGVPFMIDNKSQPVGRGIYALAESIRANITASETEGQKR
jgi:pilus assembly protein CpaE